MPKILVVNEIEEIRGMIKAILESAGFEVSTSGSAKEAMEAFYQESFDLVMTDLKMPGSMNGEELLWVIKESESDTEAIVLTSAPSIDSAIECLRNELAADYLIHPIDSLKGFVATVHRALKKRGQKIKNKQRKKQLYSVSLKLKEMNQKLKETQLEVVENEKKNVYDATVLTAAHSINQPLTVLLLKAEMIEEKLKYSGGDDDILAHIESIKKSALKIYDIMDQFKSLSKPVFKDYLEGVQMIDLGKARTDKGKELPEVKLPSVPPIAKRPERPMAPFEPTTQRVHNEPPTEVEPKTILIVEDEVGIKDLICEILANQGYNTISAANGADGIRLFNKHKSKVELLITDIRMPKVNGIELYHQVMKSSPKLPVICLTGYDIDFEAQKLFNAGKIKLLTKPFALKELVFLVKKELDDDKGLLKASSD
jgi:DNA-binding response OmpR family regulator